MHIIKRGERVLIHIVRSGENIHKILDHYGILRNELISENRHITDFSNLKPGTKLKIPVISNQVIEALEETEPFVEEYYPKAKELTKDEFIKEKKEEEIIEEIRTNEETIPSNSKPNKPKERNNPYRNPKIRKI